MKWLEQDTLREIWEKLKPPTGKIVHFDDSMLSIELFKMMAMMANPYRARFEYFTVADEEAGLTTTKQSLTIQKTFSVNPSRTIGESGVSISPVAAESGNLDAESGKIQFDSKTSVLSYGEGVYRMPESEAVLSA
jgi:hypothetical protein